MVIEFYPVEKLKNEILAIVGEYLDLNSYRVFFFGSRVTGKNTKYSDIDIGVEGPKPVSVGILAKIREDMENLPLLYKIDVVDFTKVSADFRDVALQHIEELA